MLNAMKIASACVEGCSENSKTIKMRDWMVKAVSDSKRYSKRDRMIWAMILTAWGL